MAEPEAYEGDVPVALVMEPDGLASLATIFAPLHRGHVASAPPHTGVTGCNASRNRWNHDPV